MSAQNIEARVARVIAEHGGLAQADVKPDSTFESLGLDELDGIEILLAAEDEFGIQIPDDVEPTSVPELIQAVRNQIGAVA